MSTSLSRSLAVLGGSLVGLKLSAAGEINPSRSVVYANWNADWDRRDQMSCEKFVASKGCPSLRSFKPKSSVRYIAIICQNDTNVKATDHTLYKKLLLDVMCKNNLKYYDRKASCGVKDLVNQFEKNSCNKLTLYDPLLSEVVPMSSKDSRQKCVDSARVETAFRKYFYRPFLGNSTMTVIFCKCSVRNYFVARALQLPESTLERFKCNKMSMTTLQIDGNGRISLINYSTNPEKYQSVPCEERKLLKKKKQQNKCVLHKCLIKVC